jgi:hypothetical protein
MKKGRREGKRHRKTEGNKEMSVNMSPVYKIEIREFKCVGSVDYSFCFFI